MTAQPMSAQSLPAHAMTAKPIEDQTSPFTLVGWPKYILKGPSRTKYTVLQMKLHITIPAASLVGKLSPSASLSQPELALIPL